MAVPLVLLALIPVVIVISARARRQHEAEMADWAAANGFSYQPTSPELAQMWSGEPFVGGWSGRALDVLTGKTPNGEQFCSFDYTYEQSTGKSTTTVHTWVLAVRLPAVLPWLTVTQEGIGSRIAEAFGGQDIKLESDEFNKAFRVESGSQAFAYAVLHPRTMEWLLDPHIRGLTPWRITGADMLHWRAGVPQYEWLLPQVQLMSQLVRQIPSFVWHDYGRPTVG